MAGPLETINEAAPPGEVKDVEWGCTPWDELPRETLLLEVQRWYWTANGLRGVVDVCKNGMEGDPSFWTEGPASKAVARDNFMHSTLAGYDAVTTYTSFFRYADDLLFPASAGISAGWCVCPECGQCLDRGLSDGVEGRRCAEFIGSEPGCPGVLRPIRLQDMRPVGEEAVPALVDATRRLLFEAKHFLDNRIGADHLQNAITGAWAALEAASNATLPIPAKTALQGIYDATAALLILNRTQGTSGEDYKAAEQATEAALRLLETHQQLLGLEVRSEL